jgi:5-methylcytosine-specific restriction enzyme subunit McrC
MEQITLTERTAAECRLSPADVDFLLAEHATHVQLAPTGQRSLYRLTPAHYVGMIGCPSSRLVIRPKIPLTNLFALLDPAAPLTTTEDQAAAAPGAEAFAFLAARLAQFLSAQGTAGLHRAYAERFREGPFLQGRLDLPSQVREAPGRKDRLHSCSEDFTVDVPCNQVPRATAELVLASPLLGESIRAALRQGLRAFAEVQPVALRAAVFAEALPAGSDPQARESYRLVLDLCRLLFEGLSPRQAAGPTSCPTFLLDMERVFERYCTAHCVTAFADASAMGTGFTVSVQPLIQANAPVVGQPNLQVRPDLTIDWDGQPVLVLDAKWKRLGKLPLVTENIYQVLAYCTVLGAQRAVLVYPGRRDRSWEYRLARAPTQVSIRTVRVVGPLTACARSAQRLTRIVRRASSKVAFP